MIFALTLLGCTTWIDQEPACEQDVYYWSDDLLAHVLTGDGSGEFDYDPEDEPRTGIRGDYDPADGDFAWRESFDDGYFLDEAQVDGFGTAYHNGNLDLLFTRTVTDILEDTWSTVYRVQRSGCAMTIATWDADAGSVDDALVMQGVYADESVWEWEAEVTGASYRGSLRKNLLRTEQIEADDGSYWYFTTAKPDGETTTEFTSSCGDNLYCEGGYTQHFDGSRDESYEAFDGDELVATVEGEYDYDGSGTQTVSYVGGDECTFAYDADGECTYECSDGTDGSC